MRKSRARRTDEKREEERKKRRKDWANRDPKVKEMYNAKRKERREKRTPVVFERAVIPDGTLHLPPDKLNRTQKKSFSGVHEAKDAAKGGIKEAVAKPICIHEECNSAAETGDVACIEHGEL